MNTPRCTRKTSANPTVTRGVSLCRTRRHLSLSSFSSSSSHPSRKNRRHHESIPFQRKQQLLNSLSAQKTQRESIEYDDTEEGDSSSAVLLPHEVQQRYKRLLKRQEERSKALTPPTRKTHKRIHISSGVLRGRTVVSPSDKKVRPMMSKVRGAVFSMLTSRVGVAQLPGECRWLDLFAGTGSVGIEAISRGCGVCHFVELDQWTAKEVLHKNIESLGLDEQCVVHNENVFDFLSKFSFKSDALGGPFDFVRYVCGQRLGMALHCFLI